MVYNAANWIITAHRFWKGFSRLHSTNSIDRSVFCMFIAAILSFFTSSGIFRYIFSSGISQVFLTKIFRKLQKHKLNHIFKSWFDLVLPLINISANNQFPDYHLSEWSSIYLFIINLPLLKLQLPPETYAFTVRKSWCRMWAHWFAKLKQQATPAEEKGGNSWEEESFMFLFCLLTLGKQDALFWQEWCAN